MAPCHGGPPGAYSTCIRAVEQGWRSPPLANMVQVMTAQESTCEQQSSRAVAWTMKLKKIPLLSRILIAALGSWCGVRRRGVLVPSDVHQYRISV